MIEWFFKLKYFCPDDYQKTVYDINYQKLWDDGIRTLLIDLDNTLIPYDDSMPTAAIKQLFVELHQIGFEVVIVSNNHRPRVRDFSNQLNVAYVSSAKKPLRSGFIRALKQTNSSSNDHVCLIGDQFMTDVFGGTRMGFKVIVVDAIKRKAEMWFTRMNRRLERRLLRQIKRHRPDYYNNLRLAEKR